MQVMINKDEKIYNTMVDVAKIVEDKGYKIWGIFLQGSQNYGLDIYNEDYQSDMDFKCFVLPSFDDLYFNKKTSFTETTPYGLVDIKDIRLFIELLDKANLQYIELLFTKYRIIKGDESLFKYVDNIIEDRKKLLYITTYGMATEKYKALTHPYPTIVHKIEKFGYDPKQLHHLFRLLTIANGMRKGTPLRELWDIEDEKTKKQLLSLKLGINEDTQQIISLEDAKILAQEFLKLLKFIRDENGCSQKEIGCFKEIDVIVKNIIEDYILNK